MSGQIGHGGPSGADRHPAILAGSGQTRPVPDYAAMERYLGRCIGLVVRLQGLLPASSLDEAQHLMNHGEPAEGVRSLAWSIVENRVLVPRDVVHDLRELTAELIGPEHMPQDLDRYIQT